VRTRTGWRRGLLGALASVTAALGLTAGLVQPAAAADGTPRAVTMYRHTSEAGDSVGQGTSVSYTSATASIEGGGSTPESARVRVFADDTWWEVTLAAPKGDTLRPGVYRNVEKAAFRTGRAPGLDVSGRGRGCDDVYGQFAVNQVEIDATTGQVAVLDATFTQRCGSPTAPALKGAVKYRAFPLSYSYTSDPDDWVGRGAGTTHTGATSTFDARKWAGGAGIAYSVSGKREYYSALMTPPTGEQFEVGRTYPVAETNAEGVAGLTVSGNGRACSSVTGHLTFTRLARAEDGTIKAFAATYVQHCGGSEAGMRGTIRYYA
jgi:hypothetical protein